MRLAVVIPCLNEARTIAAVIAEAKQGLLACGAALESSEIVVADNGSTDGSQALASAAGARVVAVPVRGYGAALHWGMAHADADFVIFGDADMSYDFTLLPRFVEASRDRTYDLVLGTRLGGEIQPGAMPFLNRHLGTPVLNLVIRACFGFRTTDCNSGMRLVRRDFYRSLNMRCPGMEWASELLIKTAVRHGSYREVPIRLRPDQRGRPPHMRRWRDGWRHLKSIAMLAPNRVLLLPAALLAAGSVLAWHDRPGLAATGVTFAYLIVLMGLGIKLLLHLDGVRPSKVVGAMVRLRMAETGVVVSLALLGASAALFAGFGSLAWGESAAALLAMAGGATLLEVLFLETVRTHLVSDLQAAWTDAGAATGDRVRA
ncbi:MAG: glycosyltransferase family 2 protein [Planctomycetes bacterium]|nr:glycosyltransferase family 2 protein [Planctomycetota bacterium]